MITDLAEWASSVRKRSQFVKEGHRPVICAPRRSLIGDIADKVDIELGDVLDMPRLLQAIKAHR